MEKTNCFSQPKIGIYCSGMSPIRSISNDNFKEFSWKSRISLEISQNVLYYKFNLDQELRDIIAGIQDRTFDPEYAERAIKSLFGVAASSPQPVATAALSLPPKASEVYAERKVRPELGRKENAIEFLDRVWGKYMAADILYQDDIKRLGDDKLVQAVRGRCRDDGINPATILPPPGSKRAERSMPALSPEQAEAAYLMVARQKTASNRR